MLLGVFSDFSGFLFDILNYSSIKELANSLLYKILTIASLVLSSIFTIPFFILFYYIMIISWPNPIVFVAFVVPNILFITMQASVTAYLYV